MAKGMAMPPTRASAAAEELRRRILQGVYEGGAQLRQDALAEEFNISRIPVREALVQLEAEGLVRIQAHKGAVVTTLSPEEVDELYEFRALVEPRLLEKSAPKLTAGDFEQLDAILREYRDELRNLHVGRWGELNTQLHAVLYRHAASPRMNATALQLLQSTDRFTRINIFYTDGRARAEREHEEIVAACRGGDVKAASRLLRRHIMNAGTALARLLRTGQHTTPRGAA